MSSDGCWYLPLLGRPFDATHWNCWTLVREALAARFDVEVPEHGGVSAVGALEDIAAAVASESATWLAVAEDEEMLGDVLVFDFLGAPSHVGVVVADGLFLHVSEGIVSRVECFRDPFWSRRVRQRWRHPAIATRHEVLSQAQRFC